MADDVRPLDPSLMRSAHALNQHFASEISDVSLERFSELAALAVLARVIGRVDGFLMAFDENTPEQGENHGWFKAHYPRFIYIDRVAVSPRLHGQGLARRLYRDAFGWASSQAYPLVCCEVNVLPPNPRSDAFHDALGFTEIAQRTLADGKRVRYLIKSP